MTTFLDLGLHPETQRAIDELGYTSPTPIQEQAIPYIQMGRDVIGVAQTGTGKTASFTLPMIDILAGGRAKARMPRSLILSPTRELATQIAENFDQFSKYHPITKALLIGGENLDPQIRMLDRGVDVLIATPGRLLDLFERGRILMNDIKVFVIDEADRMLDMGFIPDIERIGKLLPPLRQSLMFSATMEPAIKRLAEKFLSNPKEITVARPATTAATITKHLVKTTDRQKRAMLRHILRTRETVTNAMIFCNRKRDVDVLVKSLARHGFNVAGLHGDMAQSARTETLDKFRDNKITLLVCSDVAARGLDIKGVSHVFNFDVPFNAEDYVHRIGRTGRAGQLGIAYTLATPSDDELLQGIVKLTQSEIPLLELPDFVPDANAEKDGGGRNGGRSPREGSRTGGRGNRGGKDRGERGGKGRGDRGGKSHSQPQQSSGEQKQAQPQTQEQPQAQAPAQPQPQAQPQPLANQQQPRPEKKGREKHHPDTSEEETPARGFGDNVPDFLNIAIK